MKGINYVLIGGNIGRDPEIKYLASGDPVANFSLAISNKWKSNGEVKERTDWIRVVAHKGGAEIVAKYLSRGDSVIIIGKLSVRKWNDRDGNEKQITEVVAKDISFVRVKNKEHPSNVGISDEGVPF